MGTPQFPSVVMILRHGEKPGDPGSDDVGGISLSAMGSARAAALPKLFTSDPTATPVSGLQQIMCDLTTAAGNTFSGAYSSGEVDAGQPRFQMPKFLFATQQKPPTKHHPSGGSNRPVETITPLAQALQFFQQNPALSINSNYSNDSNGIQALTSEILNSPGTYGGQVVLICWHHGTIPQVVQGLGVPAAQFPKWPDPSVFDLLLCITWDSGQVQLAVNYQKLLFGDTNQ